MAYVNKVELAHKVEYLKNELQSLASAGKMDEYRELLQSERPLFYLTHFSNEDIFASDEIANYIGASIDDTVKKYSQARSDEQLEDMLKNKKQAVVKSCMMYPSDSLYTIKKMLIRNLVSKVDFKGYEIQVKDLPQAVQDVISNPDDVWKICDSAQVINYHLPKGKEWEALDWIATNAPEKFSPVIHTSATSPFTRSAVVERYSQMPQEELPEVVKDYIARSKQFAVQKLESNEKVREYWKARRKERQASWYDEDGRLLKFFKLEDNFPISSPQDYLFIAETFKNANMTAYAFCKQYKISDVDGFREMLKKVSQNDPEFAEFYEKFSQQKSKEFVATTRRDIVAVATNKVDIGEVIDSSTDARDFETMISMALRTFDRTIVASKFVENIIAYYYNRVNSYGEYSTDEDDLKQRLTQKEIKFLMGTNTVDDLKSGKQIDFSQVLTSKMTPVLKFIGKDTRVKLYDGKTGVRSRLKTYSSNFNRNRYLDEVVEFLVSDGRGVAVDETMIDNAECFVHDHKLFKSAGVMTRVIKAVAEGKIQNEQETADYHARLQRKILKNIQEVRTLEEYFGKSNVAESPEEKPVIYAQ